MSSSLSSEADKVYFVIENEGLKESNQTKIATIKNFLNLLTVRYNVDINKLLNHLRIINFSKKVNDQFIKECGSFSDYYRWPPEQFRRKKASAFIETLMNGDLNTLSEPTINLDDEVVKILTDCDILNNPKNDHL